MTKKYWLVALLALGIAGCSDDDKKSGDNNNQPEATCGNHQLDENEVCDGEADLACTRFDSSKTWKEGGLAKCSADCKSIEKGTCELVTPECSDDDTCAAKDPQKPKCDQGVCIADPNAKECQNNDECIAKDSNKPVCKLPEGVCVADEKECQDNAACIAKDPNKPVCKLPEGVCVADEKECQDNAACIAKDPNKPVCKFPEGVCVADEKECQDNAACIAKDPNKPVCKLPEGVCVADEKECQNNDECIAKDSNKPVCKLPEGVCVADEKECENNAACIAKYGDEKPVCNDDGVCEAETIDECKIPKDRWCQLMGPVKVEFDETNDSADISAYVIIDGTTNKSENNDGGLEAHLIYSQDINDKDMDNWPHVEAEPIDDLKDCAMDGYKATLTTSQLALINSNKAYYTFRFRENTGDDSDPWIYCTYNKEDVSAVDKGLKTFAPDKLTAYLVGLATNLGDVNQIIARFDFEKGDPAAAKDAIYSADEGVGTIQAIGKLNKLQCLSIDAGGCFPSTNNNKSWLLGGWLKARSDAIAGTPYILISGLDASGAKNINLNLEVWRNATDSPDKMVIAYSTDGENYQELSSSGDDLSLIPESESDYKLQKFYPFSLELPSAVNNASSLSIKLFPYGQGNKYLRFDNIVISKNNN